MTKREAIQRVLKVRALGRRPGTHFEGAAADQVARHIMERFQITESELAAAAAVEDNEPSAGVVEQPPQHRRAALDVILRDHQQHPERVHMAINFMMAICGVRPTFVWTESREIAIASGVPCPHCLDIGITDARRPWDRVDTGRVHRLGPSVTGQA